MMNTIRDAEIRIKSLEREIEHIKKVIRILNNDITSVAPVPEGTEITSTSRKIKLRAISASPDLSVSGRNGRQKLILEDAVDDDESRSGDGETIYHRLFHRFRNLIAETFQAFNMFIQDLTVSGNIITLGNLTSNIGSMGNRFGNIYCSGVDANGFHANIGYSITRNGEVYQGLDVASETVMAAIEPQTGIIQFKGWDNNNYQATIIYNINVTNRSCYYAGGLRLI